MRSVFLTVLQVIEKRPRIRQGDLVVALPDTNLVPTEFLFNNNLFVNQFLFNQITFGIKAEMLGS